MKPAGLAALAVMLTSPLALAQTAPPRYLVLHQELARPSQIKEYEATTREFVAMVKAHKATMPSFSFDCLMSRDFTYTYVTPAATLAAVDAILAEFGALAQAAGGPFADLMKRGGAATEYVKDAVVERQPQFSYTPAQPRLKPEELRYFRYDLYYLMPGREAEADAVAADYLKLFKARNVPNGYNVHKAVFGPELPLLAVSIPARDAADFHAEDAKVQALLGAEGQALAARALALTRRFETREAVLRPDLSLSR
jgi:hypothetical protein